MRNTYPENLSEHAMETAAITHCLALIRNRRFGGHVDAQRAALIGLFHDCTEIITGDLPTPIKYYNPAIKNAYKQVEEIACQKLLATLPAELRPAFQPLLTEAEYRDIVKAADKLSAYIKCIEERRAGNDEFLSAEKQTRSVLEQNPLPEVAYFMAHFIPAFELTLDELGTIEEE